MKRIAIIEDDEDIVFSLRLNLQREGYAVAHYAFGQEGLAALLRSAADLLILDLNLPDLDGFTICRELRRDPRTRSMPILMLTARGSEADRVTGLELGADDYVTKPFSFRELVARIAAVLRRSSTAVVDVYDDGVIRIDAKSLRVYCRGEEVKMARKEFELLMLLVRNRSNVVSREQILSDVWQMSDAVETRTVDAHVRNLRKKIGAERISTVIGFGYRYEAP